MAHAIAVFLGREPGNSEFADVDPIARAQPRRCPSRARRRFPSFPGSSGPPAPRARARTGRESRRFRSICTAHWRVGQGGRRSGLRSHRGGRTGNACGRHPWRRSTSFGVRYSRSRRSALRGRRGVTELACAHPGDRIERPPVGGLAVQTSGGPFVMQSDRKSRLIAICMLAGAVAMIGLALTGTLQMKVYHSPVVAVVAQ